MELDLAVFCERHLRSSVSSVLFEAGFMHNVCGLELRDGRRVVIKLHERARGLAEVVAVQRYLYARGFPCAEPLGLVDGRIVVESLVEGGSMPDPELPVERDEMAGLLARLIGLGAGDAGLVGVPWANYRCGGYEAPPGKAGGVESRSPGIEWVDELAGEAASRLDASAGPGVVGHGDWQAANMAFRGGRALAVFDWESLVVDRESAIVGFAASAFVDRQDPAKPEVATPEEWEAFVAGYERGRGLAVDRQLAGAASVWLMAYWAHWSHPVYPSEPPHWPGTCLGMLYRYGRDFLRL